MHAQKKYIIGKIPYIASLKIFKTNTTCLAFRIYATGVEYFHVQIVYTKQTVYKQFGLRQHPSKQQYLQWNLPSQSTENRNVLVLWHGLGAHSTCHIRFLEGGTWSYRCICGFSGRSHRRIFKTPGQDQYDTSSLRKDAPVFQRTRSIQHQELQ